MFILASLVSGIIRLVVVDRREKQAQLEVVRAEMAASLEAAKVEAARAVV